MKCEAETYYNGGLYRCRNEARFKIIDIVCEYDENDSEFWICDKCVKDFIGLENCDDPHYIILKERDSVKVPCAKEEAEQ